MKSSPQATGWAGLAAALLLLSVLPAPAMARMDPGTLGGVVPVLTDLQSPLMRMDTQFVRGDSLTGAGSAAPSWVPER